MAACAVCHSDVSFIDGDWGGTLPAVYGHEAAGLVEEVGPGAGGLAVGDHVVVTLVRSCGRCVKCRRGQPTLCEGLPPGGSGVLTGADGEAIHQAMCTGAFAELALVDASQVVRVPDSVPLESASLLACGVLTGVGAVLNTAAVEPGSTVVVLGTGGVGLNCVQGAALAGAAEVVAVDLVASKLDVARTFGATSVVDASKTDPEAAVQELTSGRGADHVLVAAGVSRLIESGARMLARGGTLVIVGIPAIGTSVSLDPVAISDGSLRVLGSKMRASRPKEDIPKLVELYQSGRLKLDELVSGRFALDDVNEAIESGRTRRAATSGDRRLAGLTSARDTQRALAHVRVERRRCLDGGLRRRLRIGRSAEPHRPELVLDPRVA